MRSIYCRDAGYDCETVIRAKNEQEVLNLAAKHAKEVHGVKPTPELAEVLIPLIREE